MPILFAHTASFSCRSLWLPAGCCAMMIASNIYIFRCEAIIAYPRFVGQSHTHVCDKRRERASGQWENELRWWSRWAQVCLRCILRVALSALFLVKQSHVVNAVRMPYHLSIRWPSYDAMTTVGGAPPITAHNPYIALTRCCMAVDTKVIDSSAHYIYT